MTVDEAISRVRTEQVFDGPGYPRGSVAAVLADEVERLREEIERLREEQRIEYNAAHFAQTQERLLCKEIERLISGEKTCDR